MSLVLGFSTTKPCAVTFVCGRVWKRFNRGIYQNNVTTQETLFREKILNFCWESKEIVGNQEVRKIYHKIRSSTCRNNIFSTLHKLSGTDRAHIIKKKNWENAQNICPDLPNFDKFHTPTKPPPTYAGYNFISTSSTNSIHRPRIGLKTDPVNLSAGL